MIDIFISDESDFDWYWAIICYRQSNILYPAINIFIHMGHGNFWQNYLGASLFYQIIKDIFIH